MSPVPESGLLAGNGRPASTVRSQGHTYQVWASVPWREVVTNDQAVMYQEVWTPWNMKPISRLNFLGWKHLTQTCLWKLVVVASCLRVSIVGQWKDGGFQSQGAWVPNLSSVPN